MDNNDLISDVEIYLLAQFMDVLESIEKIDDIDFIKNDIKLRKKQYQNEIEKIIRKRKK